MPRPSKRKVFVVHGRDKAARRSLYEFLRAIGLQPLEWSQAVKLTRKPTPSVDEVLRAAFRAATAVVVLMTGDDRVRLRKKLQKKRDPKYEKELRPQARPNVLYEAGMAMALRPDRTVLVQIGELRPFSDIGGKLVLKLKNKVARRKDLAQRLEAAGCRVDLSGEDWLTAGDFENSG